MSSEKRFLFALLFILAISALVVACLAYNNSTQPLVRTRATMGTSAAVSSTAVSSETITQTSLLNGSTNGSFVLGANSCSANTVIRFRCGMVISGPETPNQLLHLTFGTTSFTQIMDTLVTPVGNGSVIFEAELALKESTFATCNTLVVASSTVFSESTPAPVSGGFDKSISNTILFTAAWSLPGSEQIVANFATLETLN